MKVKDIMTEEFETIEPSESIVEAAKKMKSLNVGVLPVSQEDRIIGMITDRDIVVRVLAEEEDAESVTVEDAMSPEIVSCSAEDEIEHAADLMKEKQIRRLVVFDIFNKPVGVLTLGDIAAKTHASQLSGQILEAVSVAAKSKKSRT